jgi:hypothetical protein
VCKIGFCLYESPFIAYYVNHKHDVILYLNCSVSHRIFSGNGEERNELKQYGSLAHEKTLTDKDLCL